MLTALLLTLVLQDSSKPDLPLDGIKINTGPFVYSGARPHIAVFVSDELDLDVEPLHGSDFTLHYETKTFRAIALGFTANHGLIRTSLSFQYGEWEGTGTLSTSDGFSGTVDLTGRMYGAELDLYWPALVLGLGSFEISVGPQAGGHFMAEQVDDFDDFIPEFAWSVGPRASLRISGAKFGLSVDAGVNFLFGDLQGPVGQLSLAVNF